MKYDLYCLGSALVDMTFQIDDDFTKRNEERGISKGAMTLIEKDDQNSLISELKDLNKSPERACGGSGTNSIVAASLLDLGLICPVLLQMMKMADSFSKIYLLMELIMPRSSLMPICLPDNVLS